MHCKWAANRVAACMLALSLMVGLAATVRAQQADIILHNGKVLTVDKSFSIAQAVAIT